MNALVLVCYILANEYILIVVLCLDISPAYLQIRVWDLVSCMYFWDSLTFLGGGVVSGVIVGADLLRYLSNMDLSLPFAPLAPVVLLDWVAKERPEFLAKELFGLAVLVAKWLAVDRAFRRNEMLSAVVVVVVVVVVGPIILQCSCAIGRLRPGAADVVMTVTAGFTANDINYIYKR